MYGNWISLIPIKTKYFDRWATLALEYVHALSLTLIFGSRWVEGVCCLNWIYCALWQCVILFNVCVSASYIETCTGDGFFFHILAPNNRMRKTEVPNIWLYCFGSNGVQRCFFELSQIFIQSWILKKKMCELQVPSDIIRHNCVSENLVSMILLVINEKYCLL